MTVLSSLFKSSRKQYAYPTVGLSGTGLAVVRGVFIPYRTVNGVWRLSLNVRATMTTGTSLTVTVAGVTFKNAANFYQAVAAYGPAGCRAACTPNTGEITLVNSSSDTAFTVSGDVELESKPSWAD